MPRPLKSEWIEPYSARPGAACRLFCFPYAGGSGHVFGAWQSHLPGSIEVCPVQSPGRGRRLNEPAFTSIQSLIPALARHLAPWFDRPFAFFGHSVGAIVAFELARWLRRARGREPMQLFVSGSAAPQVRETGRATYDLPDVEFRGELRRLNGTPAEILDSPEALAVLMPLLRADFELAQVYRHETEPPLDCPITAFGGCDDGDVREEHVRAWGEQTRGRCSVVMLPGDHFFLTTARESLMRALRCELVAMMPNAVQDSASAGAPVQHKLLETGHGGVS